MLKGGSALIIDCPNPKTVKLRSCGWVTDSDVYEELVSVAPDGTVTAHHDALDRWADSLRRELKEG